MLESPHITFDMKEDGIMIDALKSLQYVDQRRQSTPNDKINILVIILEECL